jgi:hypothetical protein
LTPRARLDIVPLTAIVSEMRVIRRPRWCLLILFCVVCAGAVGCWDKEIHEASSDRGPMPQAQR